LVIELSSILGIITERLILTAIDGETRNLKNLLVCDFMNRDLVLVAGSPSGDVSEIMGMVTNHRVRHLPITDSCPLAGKISAGNVVKAQLDLVAVENHYSKACIQG